jgi:PPK2 family polyphosphate:nucleotide phosphotransferase
MFDRNRYRVEPGSAARLDQRDPASIAGYEIQKSAAKEDLRHLRHRLDGLQRRLWAESERGLLMVLQAIDTGGKDGTIRHVFKGVNPQGVKVHSFGVPTPEESSHDFLWRAHQKTPAAGSIAIFNRSHYEDVLVVRVKGLTPEERWRKRYHHIVEFERMLADEGTTIVKIFLHISKEEQRRRLQSRLNHPDKRWKFSAGDLDDRRLWPSYMDAFEEAITSTSTEYAPWYVVPADHKWHRNLVVSGILVDTLEAMDPHFPEPDAGLDGLVVT